METRDGQARTMDSSLFLHFANIVQDRVKRVPSNKLIPFEIIAVQNSANLS